MAGVLAEALAFQPGQRSRAHDPEAAQGLDRQALIPSIGAAWIMPQLHQRGGEVGREIHRGKFPRARSIRSVGNVFKRVFGSDRQLVLVRVHKKGKGDVRNGFRNRKRIDAVEPPAMVHPSRRLVRP